MICMCKLFYKESLSSSYPRFSEIKSRNDEGLLYNFVCLFAFTKTIYFVKYNLSDGFQMNM